VDAENLVKMLEQIFNSSLPESASWILFLIIAVIRPLNKRLNGISLYIKKFLVIQQRRAKATEKLDETLAKLVEHLEKPC